MGRGLPCVVTDIAQPHDRFVKVLLSDPGRAGALLRERLPEEISSLLSPDPPVLVDGSFVDEALRSHLTDRLFQAKTITGRTALLYVLVEHKSFPDHRVGWQVVKYTVEWWKQWEREHPDWEMLPPVIPFVFYHGASEWRISDEFLALVDAQEGWRPWLLNLRFAMMDLGKIDDRMVSRDPRLRAWLLAVKYATRENRQLGIKQLLVDALLEVPEDHYVIIRYIVETFGGYDERVVREIIRQVRPEKEETMMSQFAQDIIAQGKPHWLQEGQLKGRQEGEAALLLRQLQRRFGPVSESVTEWLHAADLSTLELWGDRVLDARSLDDVFRGSTQA